MEKPARNKMEPDPANKALVGADDSKVDDDPLAGGQTGETKPITGDQFASLSAPVRQPAKRTGRPLRKPAGRR